MSMMVSFVLSFFPRDVLDEILNLIESVSEDFPSYFCILVYVFCETYPFIVVKAIKSNNKSIANHCSKNWMGAR